MLLKQSVQFREGIRWCAWEDREQGGAVIEMVRNEKLIHGRKAIKNRRSTHTTGLKLLPFAWLKEKKLLEGEEIRLW